MKAVLIDIEGTMIPLSFVQEVLFPYARKHMKAFLEHNQHVPAIQKIMREVSQDGNIETIAHTLDRWMAEDAKITSLKELQGRLWEEGYGQGVFTTPLYDEVAETLNIWKNEGLSLYIYSSGSIQAQQLLFSHTQAGNLSSLFSGYFDTTIGSKREAHSYSAIADKLKLPPAEILFLSDVEAELDAAQAAGMGTCLVCREKKPAHSKHQIISHFKQITIAREVS